MTDELNCELRSFGHYTAEIERKTNSAEAYFYRGRLVLDQSDRFDAEVTYDRKLADLFDNNANNFYSHAAADFDEAIRLRPRFMPAHLLRGQCEFRLNRIDRAIAVWEQAIRIDPSYSECLVRLAHLYATEPDVRYRNGERAVSLALQGCRITKFTNRVDLETLAAAYAESGDFQEAVKWQQRAIELHYLDRESLAASYARLDPLLAALDSDLQERFSGIGLLENFHDDKERYLFKQWQNYKSERCYIEDDESDAESQKGN